MDNEDNIPQSPLQQKHTEEKPDNQEGSIEEDKIIHMLEASELHNEDTNKMEPKIEDDKKEEGFIRENQTGTPQKSKQISKQNVRTKATVPRPFTFATEKRMSRGRRASMDFEEPKPTLLKSASLNHKNLAQSCELRHASSTGIAAKTSLRPKIRTDEQGDKGAGQVDPRPKNGTQVKAVEKKKPQIITKEADDLGSNKSHKSSTFKALPLPSFYQRKDSHSKPEAKKAEMSHSKSPSTGQKKTMVPKSESDRREEKDKRSSRSVRNSAKETMSKLLKTTRKSHKTSEENVNAVAPVSSA